MDTTTASLEQPAVCIDARGILAEAGTDIRSLSTAALGRLGEDIAARYLRGRGIRVIDRNVRLRRGEIDLVALDGDTLVIIEVKTRRTLITGVPQAAVTAQKLRRLRKLTGLYLAEHSPPHRDVRIDVVAVLAHADGTLQLEHLQGVGA
ncbi:YraN family protein [Brachybacterium timonense]|uniref:YraN family protein n=1 Tax=Brachybacterium timonense TaxID=2050896 RepID=UPI000D0BC740|nr:YraN family protein [Brachybacterium timonense]